MSRAGAGVVRAKRVVTISADCGRSWRVASRTTADSWESAARTTDYSWGISSSATDESWGISCSATDEDRIATSTADHTRSGAGSDTRTSTSGRVRDALFVRVLVVAVAATGQNGRRPACDDRWRYA